MCSLNNSNALMLQNLSAKLVIISFVPVIQLLKVFPIEHSIFKVIIFTFTSQEEFRFNLFRAI